MSVDDETVARVLQENEGHAGRAFSRIKSKSKMLSTLGGLEKTAQEVEGAGSSAAPPRAGSAASKESSLKAVPELATQASGASDAEIAPQANTPRAESREFEPFEDDPSPDLPPTHILVLVNDLTWVGEAGKELAKEVRAALRCEPPIKIMLMQELDPERQGAEFKKMFEAESRRVPDRQEPAHLLGHRGALPPGRSPGGELHDGAQVDGRRRGQEQEGAAGQGQGGRAALDGPQEV